MVSQVCKFACASGKESRYFAQLNHYRTRIVRPTTQPKAIKDGRCLGINETVAMNRTFSPPQWSSIYTNTLIIHE
jgi:hypothetical protein